jgi:hypothetical protein
VSGHCQGQVLPIDLGCRLLQHGPAPVHDNESIGQFEEFVEISVGELSSKPIMLSVRETLENVTSSWSTPHFPVIVSSPEATRI